MIKKLILSLSALLLSGAVGTAIYQATTDTVQASEVALVTATPIAVTSVTATPVADEVASSTIVEPTPTDVPTQEVLEDQNEYDTTAQYQVETQTNDVPTLQSNPQSKQGGRGKRWQGGANGAQSGSSIVELETVHGVITEYFPPTFTLITDDGQALPAEIGNINYLTNIGLNLQDGETITVSGFWNTNGSFSIVELTLDATGETFSLRDDYGPPSWRGGNGNH